MMDSNQHTIRNPQSEIRNRLGRSGLMVSPAGFGGYRVSRGVEAHADALREALTGGINLIDTSANYADGGSEELVGVVLHEMMGQGVIVRDDVVIVTKGGYIQGSNFKMAQERIESGGGFPDVVEYAPGLWHCIAPEFLNDQISRSLARMALPYVDVYLLHNPEYYLSWAAKHGVDLEEARSEYYRRIRDAFEYLEGEVARKRIGWYGISSNSFPHAANDADFTSLDEVIRIAESISSEHHFAVVQMPGNLGERGFFNERNQPNGETVIELAHRKDIGVLINRPLNAIMGDRLVRMADFPQAQQSVEESDIEARIAELVNVEERFRSDELESFVDDDEELRAAEEFVTVGATLREYWRTFGSIEHYNDVLSQHFAPRLGWIAQHVRSRGDDRQIEWYASYLDSARSLLQMVGAYYAREAQQRSDQIKRELAAEVGHDVSGSLSSLSIRAILGVEGVTSVLVGMRRSEYVQDVLVALNAGGEPLRLHRGAA